MYGYAKVTPKPMTAPARYSNAFWFGSARARSAKHDGALMKRQSSGPPPHADHVIERVMLCAEQWEAHRGYTRPLTIAMLRNIASTLDRYADTLDGDAPSLRVVGRQ